MQDDKPAGDNELLHTAQMYLRYCYGYGETPTSLFKLTGLSRASLWRLEQGVLRPRRATVCLLRLAYREVSRTQNGTEAKTVRWCARRKTRYGPAPEME